MAPHSSTLAWKILWTEEPGRLHAMGSLRVEYNWATSLWLFTFMHWRRKWQPTLVLLPGKSHGQGSLVGCSPWGHKESDTTERLHFDFSLSCIGEGNGNPLQCCCLENPRDGGAWWLPSMGSHRVGQDWSDLPAAAACRGEMVEDRGAWHASFHGVTKSRTWLSNRRTTIANRSKCCNKK